MDIYIGWNISCSPLLSLRYNFITIMTTIVQAYNFELLQLSRSLDQAYVISQASKEDITKLLRSLGNVRALLPVQVAPDEEELLKASIW